MRSRRIRLTLWIKSTGIAGWVSIFSIGLLLPIIGWLMSITLEPDIARTFALLLLQPMIPLFGMIWPLHALQTYLLQPTREVFSTFDGNSRLTTTLLLFMLYLLLAAGCLGVFYFLQLILLSTVVKLIVVLVFLLGVAYLLIAITKSSTPSFLVVILYVVFSMALGDQFRPYPLYYTMLESPLPMYWDAYLVYFLAGVMFVLLAEEHLLNQGAL